MYCCTSVSRLLIHGRVWFGPCSLGSVRQGGDPECTVVPRCPGCCSIVAWWVGRSDASRQKQKIEARMVGWKIGCWSSGAEDRSVHHHSHNITFLGCDICIGVHVESWDRLFRGRGVCKGQYLRWDMFRLWYLRNAAITD